MNILFLAIGGMVGVLYICWIMYQAVMNLKRARDAGTLPKPAYYLGLPLLYFGLLIDFLSNIGPTSIIFLELPREFLVTQRLTRHAFGEPGWRRDLARWFAANLLDPFDPDGSHVHQ